MVVLLCCLCAVLFQFPVISALFSVAFTTMVGDPLVMLSPGHL